jgi:hypothetical protein
MSRACGTYGEKKQIESFDGNTKEEDNLKDLGVDGRIILKYI